MAGAATSLEARQRMLRGRYFVTGTNTGVGKTWVACELLRRASQAQQSCYGVKPVASGCEQVQGELRNEDATALMAASTLKLPYSVVNPFAFAPAVAPHWAAEQVSSSLSVASLLQHTAVALSHPADLVIVEGAGGWLVPLNKEETLADYATALGYPVIMVVGLTLGCINHALLTAEAIKQSGLPLAAWVANATPSAEQPQQEQRANIAYLTNALGVEPLVIV